MAANTLRVMLLRGTIKGGAANATDTPGVIDSLAFIPNTETVIAQVHGGFEYSFKPFGTNGVLSRMNLAANNGADLVVAHHPHTAQGLGKSNGKWLLHSLGNFAFDQDRIETMMGILARIDMRSKATQAIRLLPVYIKGYIPTPAAGDTVNRLFRRLAENSDTGVYIYPYLGQGWVTDDLSKLSVQSRSVPISVTIDASGAGVVDLRVAMQSDEFLQSVTPNQPLLLQTGRDLLWFGDFEDIDSDSSPFDGASAHWDLTSGSKISCARGAYQGSAGLCSGRSSTNKTDSVVALRQRVRVDGDAINTPEKDLPRL